MTLHQFGLFSRCTSLPLAIWLSPAFPVGSFAYSHALEWAVAAGDLPDADALQDWLSGHSSRHGALRNDRDPACVPRGGSAHDRDLEGLARSTILPWRWPAAASVISRPARRVTPSGSRSAAPGATTSSIGSIAAIARCRSPIRSQSRTAAAAHDLDLGATLDAYLAAAIANLTSAAIRLGVIGQTDAQRILMAALAGTCARPPRCAAHATLDDVGGCVLPLRHRIDAARNPTREAVPP